LKKRAKISKKKGEEPAPSRRRKEMLDESATTKVKFFRPHQRETM
jgi:hypothetical protein